jgi:uncharacterized protein YndB with AHSA1/START domain
MSSMTETGVTTQVHRLYIKASHEAIWDAIVEPAQTVRYGYRCPVEYDLRSGGAYRVLPSEAMAGMGSPGVIIEGEVLEVDAPRKLVQTWHALFGPETAADAPTRLTWEIEDENGVSRLTLTHELDGAPNTAPLVAGTIPNAGGGWPWMLSDMKTLLETGAPLVGE